MSAEWPIKAGDLLDSRGVDQGGVGITDGRISEIADEIDLIRAQDFDAERRLVFLGLVEAHAHSGHRVGIEPFGLSGAYRQITTGIAFAGPPWEKGNDRDGLEADACGFIDGDRRSWIAFCSPVHHLRGHHPSGGPADNAARIRSQGIGVARRDSRTCRRAAGPIGRGPHHTPSRDACRTGLQLASLAGRLSR